jgi:hypothetical protein
MGILVTMGRGTFRRIQHTAQVEHSNVVAKALAFLYIQRRAYKSLFVLALP